MSMSSSEKDALIEVLAFAYKKGVENRHQALALYLKNLMSDSSGYSRYDVPNKRKYAIAAFAELESELADGYSFSRMSDDQFFEKYILPLWSNNDVDKADTRSPYEKLMSGDSPI